MTLRETVDAAVRTLSTLPAHEAALDRSAGLITQALLSGGKILTCGNGGSAAEAQHFVTELTGRYRSNRRSLPALMLGGDTSLITCIANDFSWEDVFARPLTAWARPGDVLLCFTTSGQSPNILRALSCARTLGVTSIAFLGKGGGNARGQADVEIIVESDDTARVQEAHLLLLHVLCDRLEDAFPA